MKNLMFKKVYLFFSSLFIFMVHLPFVFAKTKPGGGAYTGAVPSGQSVVITDTSLLQPIGEPMAYNSPMNLYDSLRLGSMGLARQVFDYAMKGFSLMKDMGSLENSNVISIVDFSKPSSEKRLFVIDLKRCKVLFNTYVAHGMNSGKEYAKVFSNSPESNMSSLGFYETTDTYEGKHGYSLHLQGVEKGINDNAARRDIVMHGAGYVNEEYIRQQGYIGRSLGCPAIPDKLHKSIIDKIKNGSCLFMFSPDRKYLSHSRMINSRSNTALLAMAS